MATAQVGAQAWVGSLGSRTQLVVLTRAERLVCCTSHTVCCCRVLAVRFSGSWSLPPTLCRPSLPAAVPLVRRICEEMGESFQLNEYDRFTKLTVGAALRCAARVKLRGAMHRPHILYVVDTPRHIKLTAGVLV